MDLSNQKACVIFNKLLVNSIEDTSGIFIGVNQAHGWSSYSKSNQGFGSLRDAKITHSINVVQDNDVVDASVTDTRHITLSEYPSSLQQSAIQFQSIHANSLNNGSALDLGDIKQLGWRTSRKVNYGGGKFTGGNYVSRLANVTEDNDLVDAPVQAVESIVDVSRAVKNIRLTQNPPE